MFIIFWHLESVFCTDSLIGRQWEKAKNGKKKWIFCYTDKRFVFQPHLVTTDSTAYFSIQSGAFLYWLTATMFERFQKQNGFDCTNLSGFRMIEYNFQHINMAVLFPTENRKMASAWTLTRMTEEIQIVAMFPVERLSGKTIFHCNLFAYILVPRLN